MSRINTYPINNHPKFTDKKEINSLPRYYNSYNIRSVGNTLISEVDTMSLDYITRPEFEQHQKHMDTRFDNVELKIDNAVKSLKGEINLEKVTSKRFWIGVSIPAIISLISIVINLFF